MNCWYWKHWSFLTKQHLICKVVPSWKGIHQEHVKIKNSLSLGPRQRNIHAWAITQIINNYFYHSESWWLWQVPTADSSQWPGPDCRVEACQWRFSGEKDYPDSWKSPWNLQEDIGWGVHCSWDGSQIHPARLDDHHRAACSSPVCQASCGHVWLHKESGWLESIMHYTLLTH